MFFWCYKINQKANELHKYYEENSKSKWIKKTDEVWDQSGGEFIQLELLEVGSREDVKLVEHCWWMLFNPGSVRKPWAKTSESLPILRPRANSFSAAKGCQSPMVHPKFSLSS